MMFFIISKHSWVTKSPGKFLIGVLESPGEVLDFFVTKRLRTLLTLYKVILILSLIFVLFGLVPLQTAEHLP